MGEIELVVDGRKYGGWKSIRVSRSMESLASSFELEVNDRWGGQDVPWPIAEEDACRVELDGQRLLTGYVDKRRLAISKDARRLSYSGKSRPAALVECSAVLDTWTFRKANVYDIARAVAAPFGIKVWVQEGLVLPPRMDKLVVNAGDSPFEVIRRAAQPSGLLIVSDEDGDIVITQSGTSRASPLVLGKNIIAASAEYSADSKFHRYVVATQLPGTDDASGAATRIRAEASDETVRRTERVLLVQPESGITTEYARRRADFEARMRAAKADSVSVTVQGWQQPGGELWPVNAITYVQARAIGVDGDMLISAADHVLDEGGRSTVFRLVRPDAYTPEPTAVVRKSGKGSKWKQ